MKINFLPLKLNNRQFNSTEVQNNSGECQRSNDAFKLASVPMQSLQANYMISFSAAIHDDVKSFHDAFEVVLPKTLKGKLSEYIENPPGEISKRKSPYHLNSDAFSRLADCKTVDDIKAAFPDEPIFKELKPACEYDFESLNASPLKKFMTAYMDLYLASDNDNPVFKSTGDNDLTVYLVKKAFLECNSQTEIDLAFGADINENLNMPTGDLCKIPASLYDKLGVLYYYPEDKSGYDMLSKEDQTKLNQRVRLSRFSLVSSRADFNRTYGDVYQKARRDKAVERLVDKVLTYKPRTARESEVKSAPIETPWVWNISNVNGNGNGNGEKTKYALMLTWNESSNLRQAWKEHLNRTNHILDIHPNEYNPNLMDLSENQVNQMNALIFSNPKLKEELAENCGCAYDKIQDAYQRGHFDDLKAEIEANRQAIIEETITEKFKAETEYREKQTALRLERERQAEIEAENERLEAEKARLEKEIHAETEDDGLSFYTPRIRRMVVELNAEFAMLNGSMDVVNNKPAYEKMGKDVNQICERAKLACYNYLTTTFADMIFKKHKNQKKDFLFAMKQERENENDLPLMCFMEFILNSKEGTEQKSTAKERYFKRINDGYREMSAMHVFADKYSQAIQVTENWKSLMLECEKMIIQKGKCMDLVGLSFSEIDKEYDKLCRIEKQNASKKPQNKTRSGKRRPQRV